MSNKAQNGNTVKVHYRGTFEDGQQFDSSFDRGEPISFTLGAGQMIPGFETGVLGMKVGQTKSVNLAPDQAYGDSNPEAIQEVNKGVFPDDFEFRVGGVISGQSQSGGSMMGTILSEQEDTVTLDFNHPMAGKTLNFEIELVDIEKQLTSPAACLLYY